MSEKIARRIWMFCSAVLFILVFNYLSISQSWGASIGLGFFSVVLGAETFLEACLVGTPVIAVGLLVTSYIGHRYIGIEENQQESWDTRVPSKIAGIKSGGQESKIIAFLALLFFKLMPVYVLWHLLRKFNKYAVVCKTEDNLSMGIFSFTGKFPTWNSKFVVGTEKTACSGSTFEPLVQPVLMIMLAVGATIAAMYYLYRVFISESTNLSGQRNESANENS